MGSMLYPKNNKSNIQKHFTTGLKDELLKSKNKYNHNGTSMKSFLNSPNLIYHLSKFEHGREYESNHPDSISNLKNS